MNKYDVAHTLKCDTPHSICCFCDDKGICLPKTRDYIGAPIFMKSIVSPHVNRKPKRKRKPSNDIKSLKALTTTKQRTGDQLLARTRLSSPKVTKR